MFSLVGFLKGLLIQDNSDVTKQLAIQISPSATTNTTTTISAAQTANRTISLPDASTTLVGTDATQTLTNKTIDADANTVSNIDDGNIKAGAGIDASKIADGSISNAEFQTLNGISSNIQSQLDAGTSALSAHIADPTDAHTASAITNIPAGNLSSTTVQAALNELQAEIDAFSGGGANPTLSNLTSPTAINQDLIPGTHAGISIGSATKQIANVNSQRYVIGTASTQTWGDVKRDTTPSGATSVVLRAFANTENAGVMTIDNATNDASASGSVYIESGNKTTGTGNSGNVVLRTGTSVGGTRGSIQLRDGSEGAAGRYWMSKGVNGEGTWQAANYGISSSSGAFSTSSTTFQSVTNLSVTITTSGRPVWIGLVWDGSEAAPFVSCQQNSAAAGASPITYARFRRGTTVISLSQMQLFVINGPTTSTPQVSYPLSSFWHLDTPSAGTYTYTMQVAGSSGGESIQVRGAKLVAYEI